MPRSEAVDRAIKKYEAEKVERVTFRVPKGRKAVIQEYAARHGESLSSFINRLINQEIAEDIIQE